AVPSLQPLGAFEPFERGLQEQIISELAVGPAEGTPLVEVRSLTDRLGKDKLGACPAFDSLPEPARASAAQDYLENLSKKVELHPFVDVVRGRLVFKNPIYQEYYLARYIAGHPAVPLSAFIASDRA